MTDFDASQALSEAARLSSTTRRAGRWYVVYLLIYALATFAVCLGFALVGGKLAALIFSPLWVGMVVVLSIWANRQRYVVAGMNRIHLTMIGAWTGAWLVTVFVGAFRFPTTVAWWLFGGVLTAVPPIVAAVVVARRTR